MGFESAPQINNDEKNEAVKTSSSSGIKKAFLGMLGMGVAVTNVAAENPETFPDDTPKTETSEMSAETQGPPTMEENVDFLSAELEMKKKLASLEQNFQQAEQKVEEAQQAINSVRADFLKEIQESYDYMASQNKGKKTKAMKSLEAFNGEEYLDHIQENLQKFITYYHGQDISFDEMKSGDLAWKMIMGAVETGNENEMNLLSGMEDVNTDDASAQGGKERRTQTHTAAQQLLVPMIESIKAQNQMKQTYLTLQDFQNENPIFASQ